MELDWNVRIDDDATRAHGRDVLALGLLWPLWPLCAGSNAVQRLGVSGIYSAIWVLLWEGRRLGLGRAREGARLPSYVWTHLWMHILMTFETTCLQWRLLSLAKRGAGRYFSSLQRHSLN